MPRLLLLALVAVSLQAQTITRSTFEGQPSIVLSNGKLELTIFQKGATLASLTLADDATKLSPLWNPARMAREIARPPAFGASFGHFVCVDGFGPVSAEERAAGLTGHGEAHVQDFSVQEHGSDVTLSAKLPIAQEVFTRAFTAIKGENVVYVHSTLENLLGFDRPVNWAEHATIGSPFLESGATVVDISGSRSRTRPYTGTGNPSAQRRLTSGQDFTWPNAPGLDGKPVDLRTTPSKPHYLDHATTLLDPNRSLEWATALHPGAKLIIGWIFRREEYPWLQYWGNYPSSGKFSRGIEFGTQPFDVSRREAIGMGSLFDTPTYRWLPAKSKIESRFMIFYARVPEGFTRVDDVRVDKGRIIIEDRAAHKQVTLAASLAPKD
jgi:hypothetical protein